MIAVGSCRGNRARPRDRWFGRRGLAPRCEARRWRDAGGVAVGTATCGPRVSDAPARTRRLRDELMEASPRARGTARGADQGGGRQSHSADTAWRPGNGSDRRRRRGRWSRVRRNGRGRRGQSVLDPDPRGLGRGRPEPVVAHLVKTGPQDVLEEAPQELLAPSVIRRQARGPAHPCSGR